jgi:hypothetical protein
MIPISPQEANRRRRYPTYAEIAERDKRWAKIGNVVFKIFSRLFLVTLQIVVTLGLCFFFPASTWFILLTGVVCSILILVGECDF